MAAAHEVVAATDRERHALACSRARRRYHRERDRGARVAAGDEPNALSESVTTSVAESAIVTATLTTVIVR